MGYSLNNGYNSKEDFFRTHFYNGHPRLKPYHDYLKQNLKKGEEILSIGSGRCVNELLLIEEGFNITCSDLEQPCREETLRLFPELRFVRYDVTSLPFGRRFDCIISLSVLCLFDENALLRIFKNIAESLKPGGRFIVDIGGAVDNFITRINDEAVCRLEVELICMIQRLRQRRCVVTRRHGGYRTKNDEIISIAEKAGLTLHNLKCSDYLTEIGKRSILLGRLPKRFINAIGAHIPYVRIFTFVKDHE